MAKSKEKTYEVGYGKPPMATRFERGTSGNPQGRPKGRKNVLTAFREALSERVTITENGRRRTVTKLEATAKQLANKAASGDPAALRAVLAIAPALDLVVQLPESKQVVAERDRQLMAQLASRFGARPLDVPTETAPTQRNESALPPAPALIPAAPAPAPPARAPQATPLAKQTSSFSEAMKAKAGANSDAEMWALLKKGKKP